MAGLLAANVRDNPVGRSAAQPKKSSTGSAKKKGPGSSDLSADNAKIGRPKALTDIKLPDKLPRRSPAKNTNSQSTGTKNSSTKSSLAISQSSTQSTDATNATLDPPSSSSIPQFSSSVQQDQELLLEKAEDATPEEGKKTETVSILDQGDCDHSGDVAENPKKEKSSKKRNPKKQETITTKLGIAAKSFAHDLVSYAHGDIEMEVHNKSPQIAVLWGSANFGRMPVHLERSNIKITHFIELPDNDRTLFVFERDQTFLDALKEGGSVASELESLRLAFEKAISLQQRHSNKGRGVDFWIWPLHDAIFNRMLLIRAFTADRNKHVEITWQNWTWEILRRLAVWLGLSLSRSDLLLIIQSHFGSDVALAFLFTLHYIFTMWVLASFSLVFSIIKSNTTIDGYRKHWSPLFQFGVLFPWSMFFIVKWKSRVVDVSYEWKADLLTEDEKDYSELNPDFTAWDPEEDAEYYPNWMRALKSTMLIPLLFMDIVLMCSVLAFVFWFEMWIVFEWGQCAEINSRNGNSKCQGADNVHGFIGGLFEAVPGILEGLLFELLLALSKFLAKLAVRLQNWRTRTQQELAYITQLVVFEFIGKFGWVAVLAVIFVPDWNSTSDNVTFKYDSAGKCSETAKNCLDSRIFSIVGMEEHSICCLKSRTQYDTRLALFETAVAAPFFVAQIVSMAIKTMVPSLVVRFRACFPNDHDRLHGCYCRFCRFLLRFLSCACLFDIESTGTDECQYIGRGDLIGEEVYNKTILAKDPGNKGYSPAALLTPMDLERSSERKSIVRSSIEADAAKLAAVLAPAGNDSVPAAAPTTPTSLSGVVMDTNGHRPPANDASNPGGEDHAAVESPKKNHKVVLMDGEENGKSDMEQKCKNRGSTQSYATEPSELIDLTLMTAWAEGIRESFQPMDENLETGMHFFWVISFAAFYPLGVVLAVAVYIFDIRGDLFRLTIIQKRNWRKPPQATITMLSKFMKFAIMSAIVFNSVILFVTYMQMSRWSDDPKYRRHNGLNNYFWELVFFCIVFSTTLHVIQTAVMWFFHTGMAEKLAITQNAMRQKRSTICADNDIVVVQNRRHRIRKVMDRGKDRFVNLLTKKNNNNVASGNNVKRHESNPFIGNPRVGKPQKSRDRDTE